MCSIEKVKSSVVVTESGCWEWVKSVRHGYGAIKYNGKTIGAHVYSWIAHNGEKPKDMWVLHKCDNRSCINPDHLFLGTRSDNMKDCGNKGRLYCQKPEWRNFITARLGKKVINDRGEVFNSISEFLRKHGLSKCESIRERIYSGNWPEFGNPKILEQ